MKTMKVIQPQSIWSMNEKRLSSLLESGILASARREIHFYAPSFMYYKTRYFGSTSHDFATISITGSNCALNCKHCGSKVLETMYPAESPEELFRTCAELKKQGVNGCLISGGCLADGSVPFGQFASTIARVKNELGLTVLVHTGVTDEKSARALASANVDSALIDIVGSNKTIKEICKSDITVEDYERSLNALQDSNVALVPHVIVGLHFGRLEGEYQALEIIGKFHPSAIVIIAFMPIPGTEMQKVEPPSPYAISKVLATARTMFPQTPIALGCMRPKGKHRVETDILAIQSGVDAIAFPAEQAIEFARSNGRRPVFSSQCCSQVYADLAKLSHTS
jgi:uncharacterized radical SAM superfamily protein